jgi:hypothetical protein
MKKLTQLSLVLVFMACSVSFFSACEEIEEAKNKLDDTQKTLALKDVKFSLDSMSTDVSFPENSWEGKTFDEVYQNNKAAYEDLSNYTIRINTFYLADNTSSEAADAKFGGMAQSIVFNNIDEMPLQLQTSAFEIEKDETRTVNGEGQINLETHRLPGLYIFQQIVDGNPLDTKILNELFYQIGSAEGSFNLPEVRQDIPTRASVEMKDFLRGFLESGILDEPVE